MAFEPVFGGFATRPPTALLRYPSVGQHALVRDQFTITTWLLLGALIQGLAALLLPYRNIVLVLPAFLLLAYKLISTALVVFGILPNPYASNVIRGRTALVYPSSNDLAQDKAGDQKLCVIMLAVVSNHPLGMLAPGFKETGERFNAMVEHLSANATQCGFLGASSWINACDRVSHGEYMGMLYFENEDALHAFAHGPLHSEAVQWWRNVEKQAQIGIMHELFACDKKGWEGIYVNYPPVGKCRDIFAGTKKKSSNILIMAGLGATTKEVVDTVGKSTWISPLVRVKGSLGYSKGRMGRVQNEKEWVAGSTLLDPEV